MTAIRLLYACKNSTGAEKKKPTGGKPVGLENTHIHLQAIRRAAKDRSGEADYDTVIRRGLVSSRLFIVTVRTPVSSLALTL